MTADLYYETARKLVLKDGREVFVRQLNAGDAEAMLLRENSGSGCSTPTPPTGATN